MDVSAFTVVSADPARLDQIGKAIGGAWGSTKVDEQFEGYLKVCWRCWEQAAAPRAREGQSKFVCSSTVYQSIPTSLVVLRIRNPAPLGSRQPEAAIVPRVIDDSLCTSSSVTPAGVCTFCG